jgi:hypothetical protein
MAQYTAYTQRGTRYIELNISETTNVTANTSTISWSLYFGLADGGYEYNTGNSVTLTMAGQTLISTSNIGSIQLPIGSRGRKLLQEGSFTFAHESDGTGSFPVYCQFTQTQSSAAGNNQATISSTYTCETIPRMSEFGSSTPDSWTLDTSQNITVTRKLTGSKHRAYYKIGSGSLVGIGSGITTDLTIPWNPDLSLASTTTTSQSFAATLYLRTWASDDTYIGEVTKSVTLVIPASKVRPAFSTFAISEGNLSVVPADPFDGVYIQGKSRIKVQVTADTSAEYGATVKSCTVTIAGTDYTATKSGSVWTATSAVITTSGEITVTATLTDSRGVAPSRSGTVTVYAYTAPKVQLTAYRSDSSGTEDDSGTYLTFEVESTFTQLTGGGSSPKNTWQLVVSHKTGSTTVQDLSTTAYYQTVTRTVSGLSTDNPYTVTASVSDFWTTVSATDNIETAFVLVDYHTSGRGIAFGKVAETQDLAEFALPVHLKDEITTEAPPSVIQANPTTGSKTTTGSWIDLTSITLPEAGTYIIMGSASFTAAVGTYIQVRVDSSSGNVRDSIYIANASTWHGSTVTDIVTVSTATVVKLQAMLSATSNLRTGRLKAVRII